MQLQVREATVDDVDAIVALIAMLAVDFGVDADLRPDYVAEYLRFPGCHVLLAEDAEAGGRTPAVGLLSFSLRPNIFHGADGGLVEELVVAPEARGMGVGRLLMRTAIEMMQAAGCAEAGVATGFDNQVARRLYASFGLVEESLLLERHFESDR